MPNGNIEREDLKKFFHLPIQVVAGELGICTTMLKQLCRKHGIHRWPHRKIQSLNNAIMQLESALAKPDLPPDVRQMRLEELAAAHAKKRLILEDPNIEIDIAQTRDPAKLAALLAQAGLSMSDFETDGGARMASPSPSPANPEDSQSGQPKRRMLHSAPASSTPSVNPYAQQGVPKRKKVEGEIPQPPVTMLPSLPESPDTIMDDVTMDASPATPVPVPMSQPVMLPQQPQQPQQPQPQPQPQQQQQQQQQQPQSQTQTISVQAQMAQQQQAQFIQIQQQQQAQLMQQLSVAQADHASHGGSAGCCAHCDSLRLNLQQLQSSLAKVAEERDALLQAVAKMQVARQLTQPAQPGQQRPYEEMAAEYSRLVAENTLLSWLLEGRRDGPDGAQIPQMSQMTQMPQMLGQPMMPQQGMMQMPMSPSHMRPKSLQMPSMMPQMPQMPPPMPPQVAMQMAGASQQPQMQSGVPSMQLPSMTIGGATKAQRSVSMVLPPLRYAANLD